MRPSRRGASAVTIALSITVLLGFAALVIDAGYARLVHSELQVAADAAALAAVRSLNQTARGVTNARDAAVEVGALNRADGTAVTLNANTANNANGDVVLGIWNGSTFTPSTDPSRIDSVSVTVRQSVATPGVARAAFGEPLTGVRAHSIAVQGIRLGAAQVPYYLPFGLPKCLMTTWSKNQLAAMTFVLNPATADNVGWALLGSSLSTSALITHMNAMMPCMRAWFDRGWVPQACTSASISQTVSLGNGDMQSALTTLASLVPSGAAWDPTVWGALPARNSKSAIPAASYGKMLAGPIPIFDGGAAYCTGSDTWNGQPAISGFVWGAIYDVRTNGAATDRNVWLRIDPITYRNIGDWYGGPDYGLVYMGPAVVVR